jgi:hypothetical protein
MSKYINHGATIKKPHCTLKGIHGKHVVIEEWDNDIRKYKVDFGNGFCGWYKRSELKLDKNKH